ncbi:MAG: hypothetical protein VKK03_07595 [Synechococcus sp.]|nr:hypothetical protein [Synechococcus sp.]
MYDPVYSRGFHRSRSGRVMSRAILMLNFGVIGFVITQSPWGLLLCLVVVPLFIRWRKR